MSAADAMSEPFVGGVSGCGSSVSFAAIDDGASVFGPELEASGVLKIVLWDRCRKDVAICS